MGQEVKRVLKPGGKFYYVEHIVAEEGTILIMLQKILMLGGFWPFMTDGCNTDRATDKVIDKFGFSSVSQKKYDLPVEKSGDIVFRTLGSVVQPHLMGVATK